MGISPSTVDTLGRVRRHPYQAGCWGLENLSEWTWSAVLPDGRRSALAPYQVVDAVPGIHLEIGPAMMTLSA